MNALAQPGAHTEHSVGLAASEVSANMLVARILSVFIALLTTAVSLGGFLNSGFYRDNALIITAWKGNDLVTLAVVVPLLIGTLIASVRGSDRGLLLWLG